MTTNSSTALSTLHLVLLKDLSELAPVEINISDAVSIPKHSSALATKIPSFDPSSKELKFLSEKEERERKECVHERIDLSEYKKGMLVEPMSQNRKMKLLQKISQLTKKNRFGYEDK